MARKKGKRKGTVLQVVQQPTTLQQAAEQSRDLKSFLNAIVPGVIDKITGTVEEMQANGEQIGFGSIGKIFNKVAPEGLIDAMKGNPQQIDSSKKIELNAKNEHRD